MSNITAIQRRIEYGRYYADAELTENAVYLKGQVPDDYSGRFIAQIQVCFALVSVDVVGRVLLTTYNPPELLDENDEGDLQILHPNGDILRTGNEATPIQLVWVQNTRLPEIITQQAAVMWAVAQREIGDWYL